MDSVEYYSKRRETIKELEESRKSSIITYFTVTDRVNCRILQITDDVLWPMYQLLSGIGSKDKIELFIYTRGGAMMTAPTIVKMFREYSKEFNVIIPFRCHSAGTQIALGADHIVMSSIGQLSPIDPTTVNTFNPLLSPQSNPLDPAQRKPISVEDVQAYLNLAIERVDLRSENDRLEVFKELTKNVEPLALGNVNRVYSATRSIAEEMLSLHMNNKNDRENIKRITKALTETYPHDFIITRDKAKMIGLKIVKPTKYEEELMMKLYSQYVEDLKMDSPLDLDTVLTNSSVLQQQSPQQSVPSQSPPSIWIKGGALESSLDSFEYIFKGVILPPITQVTQAGPIQKDATINYKYGSWINYRKIGGMKFE